MTVDIHHETSEDTISLEELKLYQQITAYRSAYGLSEVPLSKALSATAGRHGLDSVENIGHYNAHSWSDATYDKNDPATYDALWHAPQRLGTGFTGYAFEVATGYTTWSGATAPSMTAEQALTSWKNSTPHNNTILNLDSWTSYEWKSMGVGIYKQTAYAWFSKEADPTGAPWIIGSGSTDSVSLTSFDDKMVAGAGNDTIRGGAGADLIYGNQDQDVLYGDAGTDTLFGGLGDDWLFGGDGADALRGARGNDTLYGGSGADRFVLGPAGGDDRAADFRYSDGDRIQLQAGTVYQITSNAAGELVIRATAEASITLAGYTPSQFSADWLVLI